MRAGSCPQLLPLLPPTQLHSPLVVAAAAAVEADGTPADQLAVVFPQAPPPLPPRLSFLPRPREEGSLPSSAPPPPIGPLRRLCPLRRRLGARSTLVRSPRKASLLGVSRLCTSKGRFLMERWTLATC